MKIIISVCVAMLVVFGATAQEKKACKAKCLAAYSVCQDDYPGLAKAQRLEGKVVCRVLVDAVGKVRYAEVVKPYNPILDEKAVEILSRSGIEFQTAKSSPEIMVTVAFKLGH